MKKNVLVILSVLLVCALLTACGAALGIGDAGQTGEEQQNPAKAGESEGAVPGTGVFDAALAGVWRCYSRETDDANGAYLLFDLIHGLDFILDDGTVFGLSAGFDEMPEAGVAPMVLHTNSGRLDLLEQALTYFENIAEKFTEGGGEGEEDAEENEERKADVAAQIQLLSALQNVSVTYEIFDLTAEDVTSAGVVTVPAPTVELLEKFVGDGLRIAITADYQENIVSSRTVSETYYFYRDRYFIGEYMGTYLCGDWRDNRGNTWNFTRGNSGVESEQLRYTMTESGGTEHIGRYFICEGVLTTDRGERLCKFGAVTFGFEDFTSPAYEITEKAPDVLTLHSETEDLTLTRQ